jgi:hypothetical protein
MRSVAEQTDASVPGRGAVPAHPIWERVAIDKLPVNKSVFGRLRYNLPAQWIPAVEDLLDVFEMARKRP